MYSRDFGGIKSDGQLYNYEREYNEARANGYEQADEPSRQASYSEHRQEGIAKPAGRSLDFLRNMSIDDLLLIAITLLLLLDSDGDNDIFALLVVFLLLF